MPVRWSIGVVVHEFEACSLELVLGFSTHEEVVEGLIQRIAAGDRLSSSKPSDRAGDLEDPFGAAAVFVTDEVGDQQRSLRIERSAEGAEKLDSSVLADDVGHGSPTDDAPVVGAVYRGNLAGSRRKYSSAASAGLEAPLSACDECFVAFESIDFEPRILEREDLATAASCAHEDAAALREECLDTVPLPRAET